MPNFKQLSDAEWMRIRPATIIGSVSEETHSIFDGEKFVELNIVPGLVKIISEILDNSVDAHIRTGKAMKINMDFSYDAIEGDWGVIISDNGGGIPVIKHGEFYQPELSWLRARAGTSFEEDRETIGANGIGSFATAVFSDVFEGTSCDGKNRFTVAARHGEATSRTLRKSTSEGGCRVTFKPDLSCFNAGNVSYEDHFEYFRIRLNNLAICYPKIQFEFNQKKVVPKKPNVLVTVSSGNDLIGFDTSEEEFRQHSYINGLYTRHGGSHVDHMINAITTLMRDMIQKKYKVEVLPNHIKQKLFFVSYLNGKKNLNFDSQSKERITNRTKEVADFWSGFNPTAIAQKLFGTEQIIQPIIQAAIQKKELAERLELARAQKKKKPKIDNHIECSGTVMKDRTLFIFEGDSAISALLEVRDAKKHGGYALRGKVMNVNGMKWVDIVKNKELSELMTIIGLNADGSTDLNYGKVVILTDRDLDGTSIACLLVNFFSRWPELFQKGVLYRAQSPLWIGRKKGDTKYYYDHKSYEKAAKSGYTWQYIKGLGSLWLEDYDVVINKPILDKIELDSLESLEVAFGDSADARKTWLMEK